MISEAIANQENKGDKMKSLYRFLTSNEFKLQVEGFTKMQADLDTEKRSMARIWKQREKQLEKVLLNTTHMYRIGERHCRNFGRLSFLIRV